MTMLEAKTVALLACRFNVSHEVLYRMLKMLWGEHRVLELIGKQKHAGQAGKDLEEAAEDTLGTRPGELRSLVVADCTCRSCGYTDTYITTKRDTGKNCSACGKKQTMYMDPVYDDEIIN